MTSKKSSKFLPSSVKVARLDLGEMVSDFQAASKGMKLTPVSRTRVISDFTSFKTEQESLSSQLQYSLHLTATAPSHPPSNVTDLKTLTPIVFEEMSLETVHSGRVLICRSIVEPFKQTAVQTVVEDRKGIAMTLSLYNYLPEGVSAARADKLNWSKYIPKGAIFAIKEPYLRVTLSIMFAIRVDHPTDVIFLQKDNVFLKGLVWTPCIELGEVEVIQSSTKASQKSSSALQKVETTKNSKVSNENTDKITPIKNPSTFEDWKLHGNSLYSKKLYYDAIEAYTQALSISPKDITARCNRAAAFIQLNMANNAMQDVFEILKLDPLHEKALYRLGRAYYMLSKYDDSKICFSQVSKTYSGNTEAKKELERVHARLSEAETGVYDWANLHRQIYSADIEIPKVSLDIANYNGPLKKVANASDSIQKLCYVATKNILPGQLLMVNKAYEYSASNEKLSDNFKTNYKNPFSENERFSVLKAKILQKLSYNSQDLKEFNELANSFGIPSLSENNSGKKKQKDISAAYINRISKIVDIHGLCFEDSFGDLLLANGSYLHSSFAHSECLPVAGLWISPSYFIHECDSNASFVFIGDTMIVTAKKQIKSGQKISINRLSSEIINSKLFTYDKRHESLQTTNRDICKCSICRADESEPAGLRSARGRMMNDIFKISSEYEIDDDPSRLVSRMESVINSIKSNYIKAKRTTGKLDLFYAMIPLMNVYISTNCFRKAAKIGIEALESLGMGDPEEILKGSKNGNSSPPPCFNGVPLHKITSLMLNINRCLLLSGSSQSKSEKWLSAGSQLEKLLYGNYNAFFNYLRNITAI